MTDIAMENCPFKDDFPIKTSIYKGFSIAMLNNQMVVVISRFIYCQGHVAVKGEAEILDFSSLVLQQTDIPTWGGALAFMYMCTTLLWPRRKIFEHTWGRGGSEINVHVHDDKIGIAASQDLHTKLGLTKWGGAL